MLAVVTELTVGRKNDEWCGRGGRTLRWCHVENVLAHEDFGGGAVELHDVDSGREADACIGGYSVAEEIKSKGDVKNGENLRLIYIYREERQKWE